MDWLGLVGIGVAAGVVSGLVGIGGGIILVPLLMLGYGLTQREAQGTSLAVLVPPVGIFAALRYYQDGYLRLPVVGWVVLGFLGGAYAGAVVQSWLPDAWLRRVFGLLLVYVGAEFLLASDRNTRAALPAAVATLVVGAGALIWRRRRGPVAPQDADFDYHI